MADEKYKYYVQNNFSGGIATEPELRKMGKAGEVTVAEAADVWAPNGVLTRRPGVVKIGSATGNSPAGATVAQLLMAFNGDPTNLFQQDGNGDVYSSSTPGSTVNFYVPIPVGSSGYAWPISSYFAPATQKFAGILWTPTVGANPITQGQYVDINPLISSNPGNVQAGPSAGLLTTGQLWAQFVVTSGTDGNIYLTYNGSNSFFYGGTAAPVVGLSYAPLPSGEKYLSLLPGASTVQLQLQNSTTSSASSAGTVTPNPALYSTTANPPSWANVVDANRTYVAYSNQVYEFRPELAAGPQFRLAQVNSDPAVVGTNADASGADFSPQYIGQYSSFPNANQLLYFGGLLFFTDIKGAPNVVQWGGPAIDGAVDVLPVLSYAILTDSRDNSPNVGFGVYNTSLYVFKKNSIWTLSPAGQSDVDGSYLFTATLVVSGAGCSAPGSIVTTPAGIIFYNAGGFYIFDGQSAQKLTQSVKHLFDAIAPGSAYQMQAAHWAQQHSYVVSCQMTHPWFSTALPNLPALFQAALCYDYQNGAWWLWLSVTGVGICVDAYNNLITQSYVGEFRILDPYKKYDSDALAKSTATPYIKTQRLGYGESIQHRFKELRSVGEIDNLSVATTNTVNDQILGATSHPMTFVPVDYTSITPNVTITNGQPYNPPWGRRESRIPLNDAGQWAQVTISGAQGPFTLYNINLGYYVEGRNG